MPIYYYHLAVVSDLSATRKPDTTVMYERLQRRVSWLTMRRKLMMLELPLISYTARQSLHPPVLFICIEPDIRVEQRQRWSITYG